MLKNPKLYLVINLICIISLCYTVFAAMGYIKFGPINNLTSPNTNIDVNGVLLLVLITSIVQYSSTRKLSKRNASIPAKTIQIFSISFATIFITILALGALIIIAFFFNWFVLGHPPNFGG